MLMAAPRDAANPTKNALSGRPVSPAAAKIGARVENGAVHQAQEGRRMLCRTKARRVGSPDLEPRAS
jgi:hypothetical protein